MVDWHAAAEHGHTARSRTKMRLSTARKLSTLYTHLPRIVKHFVAHPAFSVGSRAAVAQPSARHGALDEHPRGV